MFLCTCVFIDYVLPISDYQSIASFYSSLGLSIYSDSLSSLYTELPSSPPPHPHCESRHLLLNYRPPRRQRSFSTPTNAVSIRRTFSCVSVIDTYVLFCKSEVFKVIRCLKSSRINTDSARNKLQRFRTICPSAINDQWD
jgi:hypothetical protein